MRKLLISSAASMCLLAAGRSASAQVPISTVYTGGAGTYTVSGTVSSIENVTTTANAFTLMDSSGSIFAYNLPKTVYTATAGDAITITNATNSPYMGAPELTSTGLAAGSVTINTASTGAPAPVVLTVPQFKGAGGGGTAAGGTATSNPPYAEAYVELDNVSLPAGTGTLNTATNTSYTLTDQSGNTTTLFSYHSYSNTLAALTAANSANTASGGSLFAGLLDIQGYADVFNGVAELYPLNISAAPSGVPEPASISILMGGTLIFLNRRRRSKAE